MRHHGQTLLEGMIASVILIIGVVAVIQAVLIATVQNAGAGKVNEAAAIANEMVGSLQRFQFSELTAAGSFLKSGTSCKVGDATLNALTDGLAPSVAPHDYCVADLDAFDLGNSDVTKEIVPGYDFAGRQNTYRRIVVLFRDTTATVRLREAAVIVTFLEAGQRRFIKRMISFNPSTSNAGLVQL